MILAPTPQISGQIMQIDNGLAGVRQTLATMRQLVKQGRVDPAIRQAATQAAFLMPEKDELSEVDAIFSLVRDGIRYVKDVYDVETLSTPIKTLEGRIGDCDDQTTLLAALLESIGYPTRFVVAGYHGNDYEHVYLQVYAADQWINLDPTEHYGMGWEAPNPTIISYEVI